MLQDQLSLTSALFQTETNARVSDGLGHTVNAGKQRVRGVEFGFAGNLTPKWHVFGGYSYLNAITTDAGPGSPGASGLPMVMVPKHNFTLWTSYDVMPKLTLGAGATVMSQTYASVSATTKKWTPGYARFDAAATWRVNKTMDVQLNVQNLFDKSITRARIRSTRRGRRAVRRWSRSTSISNAVGGGRARCALPRRTHHGSEYVFTFVKLFIASCTPSL